MQEKRVRWISTSSWYVVGQWG